MTGLIVRLNKDSEKKAMDFSERVDRHGKRVLLRKRVRQWWVGRWKFGGGGGARKSGNILIHV